MHQLKKYRWESTLIMIIGGVILVLTLVTHLTASSMAPLPPAAVSQKRAITVGSARGPLKTSEALEVTIGPSAISGQYTLLSATRTPATSTSDKLTLRIRLVSHAAADLVTPFQSAMLEVRSQGLTPINPEHPFSYPTQAGDSREEDVVFIVPSSLDLDRAVLRIHYYSDGKEIPLRNRIALHHMSNRKSSEYLGSSSERDPHNVMQ